jgi:hypothetical protein
VIAVGAEDQIALWTARLERVDAGVRALEASSTYQRLAGLVGERAPLEGLTAARVGPPLGALARLLDERPALAGPLRGAVAARALNDSLGVIPAEEAELRRAFTVPSIRLDVPVAPIVPCAAAPDGVVVSLEELLDATARALEIVRELVSAVQAAWTRLDAPIVRLEHEVIELRSMIELVNAAVADAAAARAELDAIDVELGAARARIARDPLGVAPDEAVRVEGTLAPRIAGVRAHLTALAVLRARVDRGLARASRMRRALHEVHEEARWAASALRAAFAGAAVNPVRDELIAGLDVWRTQVEAGIEAGRWSWAVVGIEQWAQTCSTYEAADRAVLATLAELSARQAELEARLSESKAGLDARTQRGAPPDAVFDALARVAADALAMRPMAFDAALAAVEAFERALGAARLD